MNLGEHELLCLNQVETPVSPAVPGIVPFREQTDSSLVFDMQLLTWIIDKFSTYQFEKATKAVAFT